MENEDSIREAAWATVILNKHKHRNATGWVVEKTMRNAEELVIVRVPGSHAFWPFEAIAIAEKYAREQSVFGPE